MPREFGELAGGGCSPCQGESNMVRPTVATMSSKSGGNEIAIAPGESGGGGNDIAVAPGESAGGGTGHAVAAG